MSRARRAKTKRTSQHLEHQSTKLSERLITLIQPYRDDDLTCDTYQKMITVAAAGWNLVLLPAEQTEALLEQTLEAIPIIDRTVARGLILECMRRKQELFPEDRRFVANATVIDEGDSFRVQVASLSSS